MEEVINTSSRKNENESQDFKEILIEALIKIKEDTGGNQYIASIFNKGETPDETQINGVNTAVRGLIDSQQLELAELKDRIADILIQNPWLEFMVKIDETVKGDEAVASVLSNNEKILQMADIIEFQGNELTKIPEELALFTNLKSLGFYGQNISNLENFSLPENLESFVMNESGVIKVDFAGFANCKKLLTIDLDGNKIKSLENLGLVVEGVEALTLITLYDNCIAALPSPETINLIESREGLEVQMRDNPVVKSQEQEYNNLEIDTEQGEDDQEELEGEDDEEELEGEDNEEEYEEEEGMQTEEPEEREFAQDGHSPQFSEGALFIWLGNWGGKSIKGSESENEEEVKQQEEVKKQEVNCKNFAKVLKEELQQEVNDAEVALIKDIIESKCIDSEGNIAKAEAGTEIAEIEAKNQQEYNEGVINCIKTSLEKTRISAHRQRSDQQKIESNLGQGNDNVEICLAMIDSYEKSKARPNVSINNQNIADIQLGKRQRE